MTDGIAAIGSDDASLPDRLERVEVVVGTTLLLSLPMGVVGSHLLAAGRSAWVTGLLVFAPGSAVGILATRDRITVSYGQIWSFSLVSWFAT